MLQVKIIAMLPFIFDQKNQTKDDLIPSTTIKKSNQKIIFHDWIFYIPFIYKRVQCCSNKDWIFSAISTGKFPSISSRPTIPTHFPSFISAKDGEDGG